ncbi:MAG TPA: DinB family protein [Terriglobales bacterium]|nr:DinB family protein [Terriglobales bacterium]
MSEMQKWFDRKFDLSFPVELYPNILTRLRGTPARLEELIRAYSREILIRKQGDTWSIQENAGHLSDLEPLWLSRLDDFVSGLEILRPADLSNRKTHEANHNANDVQDILSQFRKARALLVERAENFDAAMYSRAALHPRLKTPLRLVDHLYFVAEHDDQHLARIWELGKIN